ncbi:ST8SIA2 [Branchiostoma lanceolatum]|uniref:ST8SIA2 protein n=1 Tax=Branchiostoma lanceolatum TaxID=7740 RepID=A0A8J9ZX38_BRALA|nr:ST8SIA2 [Branchiostoma lanceolatum]
METLRTLLCLVLSALTLMRLVVYIQTTQSTAVPHFQHPAYLNRTGLVVVMPVPLTTAPPRPTFMDRISSHFNQTNIQRLQNITRKYLSSKRHIINFSDFNIFVEKCDDLTFTLLNSSERKTCDVIHTPIRTHRACAIVGGSGILLGSGCGAEIDAHDFVIRPNLPPTRLYEKDVGTKNNMTTVNAKVLAEISKALASNETVMKKAMISRLVEHPGMILSFPLDVIRLRRYSGPRLTELKTVGDAVRDNNFPVVVTFAHQSILANKSLLGSLARVGKNWKLPSTGLATFALASTFCDRVSLYGFHPMRWDKSSRRLIPYHYYNHGKIDNPKHNMLEEFAMFQDLHKRGIIRHVIGKCNLQAERKIHGSTSKG